MYKRQVIASARRGCFPKGKIKAVEEARAVIEEFLSGSLSAMFQLTWNIPVPGVCTCVFNVDAPVHLSLYLRPGYYETFLL